MQEQATQSLNRRYDRAAGKWHDKMRVLGYYDGYLGFLSSPGVRTKADAHVVDVGCGTAAFAEAWVAVHGIPASMTLIDPSQAMLDQGADALSRRGVPARCLLGVLGKAKPDIKADELLAAHLIEHCDDPGQALRDMAEMMAPGGVLRLVVSKPHWCNAIIWLQWRHRTFSRDEVHDLLQVSGFEIELDYAFPAGPPSRTSMGIVARRI